MYHLTVEKYANFDVLDHAYPRAVNESRSFKSVEAAKQSPVPLDSTCDNNVRQSLTIYG